MAPDSAKPGLNNLRINANHILSYGLGIAALANLTIYFIGRQLPFLVIGVAGLGLGFVLTHSTLLNRATQFSQTARGAARSLVAFFFMSGGGIVSAVASQLISHLGLETLFLIYGFALILTLALCYFLITGFSKKNATW
jgi:predicted MFS family arabinose efflux permease